jgi:hypothetical protein
VTVVDTELTIFNGFTVDSGGRADAGGQPETQFAIQVQNVE